jgi:hypothetical protein
MASIQTVLIIDDEETNRMLLRDPLDRARADG